MLKKKIKIILKNSSKHTPGKRHHKYITKYILAKQNTILKNLIFKIKKACGKSSYSGKTLLWGRTSGCKKLYRKLCFFNQNILGIILFSIYDPNRTSFISAFFDLFFFKFYYIPSILKLSSGCIVGCQLFRKFRYFLGFRYYLTDIRSGLNICLLSIKQKKIAQYIKAAGTFGQILSKTTNFCKIRLPSNVIINLSVFCFATLGIISNQFNRYLILGKAGRNKLLGYKSKVRGVAMNPVDNPHGGRTNGGCSWVTPWGKPFLFKKTSTSKNRKRNK